MGKYSGVIKHSGSMPTKHYDHNCGGKLYVDAERFLEPEDVLFAGSFFGRVTMPPGSSIGYHEQNCTPAGDFEIYYIISGKYLATFNGKEEELGPGDVMICMNGDWNGMENIGEEEGVCLAMILTGKKEEE